MYTWGVEGHEKKKVELPCHSFPVFMETGDGHVDIIPGPISNAGVVDKEYNSLGSEYMVNGGGKVLAEHAGEWHQMDGKDGRSSRLP